MYIKPDVKEIQTAVDYVKDTLKAKGIDSRDVTATELSTEEILGAMIRHIAAGEDKINVNVHYFLGNADVRISAKGDAFDVAELEKGLSFDFEDDDDDIESQAALKNLIKRVLGTGITLKHTSDVNIATIKVIKSKYAQLMLTIASLLAGLLVGLLMKSFCPAVINQFVISKIFTPISTAFLNALKMIVAPLVLFSIASSIAGFGDMKTLGRISGKVLGMYFITSIIAICVGALIWNIFPIGDPQLKSLVSDAAQATIAKGEGVSVSVVDTIVDIVPSDIINPFLKANMLQIIFIAAMVGIAVGTISDQLKCKEILNDGYLVSAKITAMIISVMPVAIFCSMAKMVLSMKLESLGAVLVWIPTIYLGDIVMILIYALIILVVGRLNPLMFFKKYYPVMIAAFTFASSNPVLPTSMEVCDKKLGISKRVYSFSLPLGATINMDGSCITQMISALFMAKIFGIPITPTIIFQLGLAIFVLSVGAPGVPGGALVCISLLVPQIGIPAEAISIIMGLYSIVGMMQTCANVTGDGVVTLVTAKTENMLDMEVFNKK